MQKVDVCFSPALLPLYSIQDSVVVVIDIFRATSSICYGIDNGASEIIPVSTVEECQSYVGKDYLLAAERNGEVVTGFDFGNSPFAYSISKVKNKKIVLTTTNGTNAINLSKQAHQIIIGSFLNLTAVCNYLIAKDRNVLLLCAGWKNKFNLEDSLFAGAVVNQLKYAEPTLCDASIAAEDIYLKAKPDLRKYLRKSSHSHRLQELNIENDILFCLQQDIVQTIPVLQNGKIVKMDTSLE